MRAFKILLLMVAVAVTAAAQNSQNAPRPADDQIISVNVDLVNVLFTVADRKGKFITSLTKDDFRILEDNKPQVITNFSNETDLPLTIALLVDTSGSIRDKLRFEQEAAIEFFYSALKKNKDKALVITFDSGVDLLQDFTDDPEQLSEAVRKMRAGGGTSLYDAIYLAVTEKLSKQTGRRVIILISDGDDNSSRISLTETLEAAQRNDVSIYSISTNNTAYFGSNEQARGDKTLKRFSEETGGRTFFPFKLQELAANFQDIGMELRAQYQLAYRSSNDKADGTFRRIRIDATNRQYAAKARTGYYAPRPAINAPRQ
jgi:VWFA-related protein